MDLCGCKVEEWREFEQCLHSLEQQLIPALLAGWQLRCTLSSGQAGRMQPPGFPVAACCSKGLQCQNETLSQIGILRHSFLAWLRAQCAISKNMGRLLDLYAVRLPS